MAFGNRRRGRAARSHGNGSSTTKLGSASRGFSRPLWLEQLEDRRMLATFTVVNLSDLRLNDNDEFETAPGSLRAAIEASNETPEEDTIFFSPNLVGTINLQRSGEDFGQLTITGSVDIIGMGPRTVTIDAASQRRVFEIAPEGEDAVFVSISGLTITGGQALGAEENAGRGGGILNAGNLTLTEVVVRNNEAIDGGGIFNASGDNGAGQLTVVRSLIQDNTASNNGGGLKNGLLPAADGGGTTGGPLPFMRIVNSTITGNQANTSTGYGGGLFNANGRVEVIHSTIVGNSAYLGSGIGSQGNALGEPGEGGEPGPLPEPTIFTTIVGSVLFANSNFEEGVAVQTDIDVVGKGEAPDPMPPDPPEPAPDLAPSINIEFDSETMMIIAGATGGNNLIFGRGKQVEESEGDVAENTDPEFILTEGLDPVPFLKNYGGSTDTFHPLETSPLIDHHDTVNGLGISGANAALGNNDQRGRHFDRLHEVGSTMPPELLDIGAVEVQEAIFFIDIVADEDEDLRYSGDGGVTTVGDFSFREAILFSERNPLVDTIRFDFFDDPDPTPGSFRTFLITLTDPFTNKLEPLDINHSLNIIGPSSLILEIDGNDPSTVFANGTRIFNITNSDDTTAVDVYISNLTVINADTSGSGAAILNRENLTLESMTLRNNRASLDGGAIHHDRGELTVLDSTISGNNSSDDGAIYIAQNSGTVLISNTTISGNTAGDRGAGVFNRGADTRIEFTTITANNSGSTIGSGVMNFAGLFASGGNPAVPANLTFYSTIIAGNFLNDVAAMSATGGTPSSLVAPITISDGYNLVGVPNAGVSGVFSPANNDISSTTPMLAPLAYAGGLTQTHALLIGSPAINRGDIAPVNAPTFDQRGNPFEREFDGKDDGLVEDRMDIGAYELQGRVYKVDNTGNASDGNFTAGQLTLREAIELANVGPLKDFIEFDLTVPAFQDNPMISPASALAITDDVEITWQGSTPLTFGGTGIVFNINDASAGTLIDVKIRGGERGVGELIFSGRGIVNTENLFLQVVDIFGNSTSAITHQIGTLDITDSTLSGNISTVSGGAINAQNAALVKLLDSTVTGNSTAFTNGHGGAIYLKNSAFLGDGLVLANNLTAAGASDGAGIYVDNSGIAPLLGGLPNPANDVRFVRSVISGNSTIGANSDGAGIFAKSADVYLNDYTTVALNTTFGTSSKGGAVYLNGSGSLTITDNVSLSFNRTIGQFSSGGAIASVGGTVNIIDTNVADNTTSGADAHGGAVFIQDGTLSVINSTFFENSTNGLRSDGGAIFSNTDLTDKQTLILNSTISGNTTEDRGGGLYNADGLTVIKHSTITNNAAPYFGFGAGVASLANSNTTRTEVGNSIIAGNVLHQDYAQIPGNLPSDVDRIINVTFQNTFLSLGYNLIGTGVTTTLINDPPAFNATGDLFGITDPALIGLEELKDNGGPSRTHKIVGGSLAINRGNPSAMAGVNGVPQFDQVGAARIQQGRIDIGSFESDFTGAIPGDFNSDGVVSGRDFLLWQRGGSLNPLSAGDLATWQANYGSGGALVAASVSTEDEFSVELAQLLSDEPAPENSESGVILLGWIMPASAPSSEADAVETESADFDLAYLTAEADDFGDGISSFADLDFGDIATNRSAGDDEDSANLSAEDAVFELIGAGQL